MVASDRWARKIVALLHDPPDKPFSIGRHEERANELVEIALGQAANEDEAKRAERADRIASAADRVDFPEGAEAYWCSEKAVLTHPLSGRNLDLGSLADVDVKQTHEAAKKAVRSLIKGTADQKQRFLRLWRCLPDALTKEFPRVGALFGMLPADTRQPDHPLTQHLSITAAIADALPQPAFLVFSIGPVQEFIAAARRTQDLWMGSWLLSYLSRTAMKSLAEEFGPDVIVFPSLRGQPLCDLWLAQDKQVPVPEPRPEDLSLASLPNKFVALLPASEAQSAAAKASCAVREEWKQLANAVLESLSNGIMPADEQTQQMWEDQVNAQLEVYWSVLPWAGDDESDGWKQAEAVKSLFEKLCAPLPDRPSSKVYALFAKPKAEGGGQYHPNWGTTYSLLYSLADRAFNARKSLRDFEPTEERGEKCTVCGQRAALRSKDMPAREFWSRTAEALRGESRYDIKPDGRERLCAICAVKRFAQEEALKDKFGLRGSFPSTSEIAAASFKAAVLQKLNDATHGPKLADSLREHLETLELLEFPHTVAPEAIPKLQKLRRQLVNRAPQLQDIADRFLGYDGEAFFAETFTPRRLEDDYGLTVSESDAEAAHRSLQGLLKAASEAGISPPAKYYAVLMMDGDRAGQWLSGTHEGLTLFGNVLHPKVREQLEGLDGWKELLNERRLMTPALHAAISDALANFARKLVRFVIEERHCGRVIYAGGDDVLALLPLSEALSAARELRALFSGQVKQDKALVDFASEESLPVDFADENLSGYLVYREQPSKEILLTMGPTASASIGIAIAHHLQPLDATLQAMREAEHDAKEVYDRNALCVYLLKRSGERTQVGAKWFYDGGPQDTVAMVNDICERFGGGQLAMKLAHAVFEESRTLSHLPKEAQKSELKRLLKRHSESTMSQEERDSLAERLADFAAALDSHAGKVGKRGFEQMADWLLLARFLAKGGEE